MQHLVGNVGLLVTNSPKEEVLAYFAEQRIPSFARSGYVAPEVVTIPKGKIPGAFGPMVEQLRKLGLTAARLVKGEVHLENEHTICKKGETLTPEQAKLLKHFEIKVAKFELKITACYTMSSNEYEELAATDME